MWKTERKANQSEIVVSSLGEAKKTVSMIYLKLSHHLYGKTPLNITLFEIQKRLNSVESIHCLTFVMGS